MRLGARQRAHACLLGLVLAASAAAAGPAAAQPTALGGLGQGEHVFWKGPYTLSAAVPAAELCGVAGPCWEYELELADAPGGRLRVAVDWPSDTNAFALELRNPAGKLVASGSGSGRWSVELFVPDPGAGTWTVRVIPEDVTASSFRARAKLEPPPSPPSEPTILAPNLQALPPWDVGLVAPVHGFVGMPADVLGFHPLSCTVDETVMNGTRRCLRFSVGPMNLGAGDYEARFDVASARPNEDGHLAGPVIQRLYRSDGSHVDRNAGTFEFHEAHAHFHVQDLLAYRLLRVVDPDSGTLEATGEGRKASFCTLDLKLADFGSFSNGPPRFASTEVCFRPPDPNTTLVMGITAGWADVYTWNLPDQYVDFGDGEEGEYVIQVGVDEHDAILESDETDNAGYALIRVEGDRVVLLERGIGESPWDPDKVVLPLS